MTFLTFQLSLFPSLPGGQHAVVPYHVRNILLKLGEQQQHHAYSDATASMETLAMAMDLVPDVLRDTGVKLLTSEPGSNKEALKMLKSMLAWQPKHVRRCINDNIFIWS